ncbi:uncharacterized protein L969DRAFT_89232 [Mixia osmundae IAM 14324]|uniref:Very-long-chain 3-oxoacyl-CoA reductase n=1 Tax=Mixia osmundae (strain CBS 9802 / IAM 14324 / JCM 22182 / KY 12970) TaxID=764103 RepID=G7DSG0_MIXOS|nr:uncharacterized protein L969DRAFT_89232 [Mixia osmundae IAM 14324]KEI37985.1 hypothetical protein L969DRAFT_89232 [Mixia osmundae IAM 14324]GAA93520.1 hypothetical protein E5Q_00161 [Mixia osmundae IAM 14324]
MDRLRLLVVQDDASVYYLSFFALVGILVTTSLLYDWTRLWLGYIFGGPSITKYGANTGAWAVVTGSTAGIGYEFAMQLGKAGFNVVLISRSQDKLDKVAKELAEKCPHIESVTHAIDFAQASPAQYEKLSYALKGLNIGVLVNNVGQSHDYPEYYHELDSDENERIVEINVLSVLRITKLVLPGMVERRRGLILNVGSFAALIPTPLLSVYSGSKAFLYTWSNALGSEMQDFGITVSLLNTYFVVSKLSKIRKPNFLTPMPQAYVKSALAHVGVQVGAVSAAPFTSTPHLGHAIVQFIIDHLGTWTMWIAYNKRLHKDIKARALRKKARDSKAN